MYGISELKQLLSKAEDMVNKHCRPPMPCLSFYRNKPQEYYQYITNYRSGVMEAYLKDHHGDQANPINGQLYGLFFGASMDKETGEPPVTSLFGPVRFNVQPGIFLNDTNNLYFSDFYCINKAHYVLLVITKTHSPSDLFCERHLVKLDKYNNPFLWIIGNFIMVTTNVWIEVFWTDKVNMTELINKRFGNLIHTPSKGQSRIDGIPKNTRCSQCNILK